VGKLEEIWPNRVVGGGKVRPSNEPLGMSSEKVRWTWEW
jgi:hypothetical protein